MVWCYFIGSLVNSTKNRAFPSYPWGGLGRLLISCGIYTNRLGEHESGQ